MQRKSHASRRGDRVGGRERCRLVDVEETDARALAAEGERSLETNAAAGGCG
jgi:hypothetical protein